MKPSKTSEDVAMKDYQFEEFDLKTTYQKLIAPSSPRMIKASDFFKLPDLLTPLKRKLAQVMKQDSNTNR